MERINFLEVILDAMKVFTEVLMDMHRNADKSWNRDISTQGCSLLKALHLNSMLH